MPIEFDVPKNGFYFTRSVPHFPRLPLTEKEMVGEKGGGAVWCCGGAGRVFTLVWLCSHQQSFRECARAGSMRASIYFTMETTKGSPPAGVTLDEQGARREREAGPLRVKEKASAGDARGPVAARGGRDWARGLAWVPLPVLVVSILALWLSRSSLAWESPVLLLLLNVPFTLITGGLIAYLVGRSFAQSGARGLLLLGCGVSFWAAAAVVAVSVSRGDVNCQITIHNTCVWLSAACHLGGVLLSRGPERRCGQPGLWLGVGYGLTAGVVAMVAIAAGVGWMPTFFVQGEGGTPVRQVVVSTSVMMFGVTGLLLGRGQPRPLSAFVRWYSLALGLAAAGLLGVMLQASAGSLLNWTARLTQLLSGVYMLVAAVASVRESGAWRISLEEALRESEERFRVAQELSPDGFLIFRPLRDSMGVVTDFLWIYENDAAARMNDTNPKEVCGKRVSEALPHHERSPFHKAYKEVAETGEVRVVEEAFYDQDTFRQRRWFRVAAVPTSGGDVAILVQDVTERRRAEEALRRSEELRRLTNEITGVGSFEWNIVTGINTWTPELERLYGLPVGGFAGTQPAWEQLVHPEDRSRAVATVERAFGTKETVEGEWRACWPDGSVRWLAGRFRVIRDAEGKPLRLTGVNIDITERKRAEEALKESEAMLGRAQQVANLGSWQWDIATDKLVWSEQIYRMWGLTAEQFTPSYEGFLSVVSAEDRERVRKAVEGALAGRPYEVEFRVTRPDSVQRDVLAQGDVDFDASGRPVRMIGTTLDITERKRAEEALRESESRAKVAAAVEKERQRLFEVLETVPVMICLLTPDYRVAFANRSFREKFGEAGGRHCYEQCFGRKEPCEFCESYNVLKTGQPHHWEVNGPDGSVIEAYDFPFTDVDGSPMILEMDVDVTDRRKAEAALKEAHERLAERTEKLQELVGELEHFSYTITHDMRSPLRAMRGFTEIVNLTCEDCERKEPREFLRKITVSAERMDRLITDALDYSRSVRRELRLESVDTGRLVRGMLDSYPELQASKAHIRLEGELPVVLGNEAGLTQCFSNLLGNAVKFVKAGEVPEIRIWAEAREDAETRRRGDAERWVRIWVEDKGIGIAKEMLPRVFDMFSRGSKRYEGTGIGLALVRKVMQRMGGKVGVESEEGRGSRFWLELKGAERRVGSAE